MLSNEDLEAIAEELEFYLELNDPNDYADGEKEKLEIEDEQNRLKMLIVRVRAAIRPETQK